MSKLIVVSNRVAPVSEAKPTQGGLAAGVRDALRQRGGLWIGWSGDIRKPGKWKTDENPVAHAQDAGPVTVLTMDLSNREYDGYYRSFSNGAVWPAFHYRLSLCNFDPEGWRQYCAVNARFAHLVAAHAEPGDLIWVHDYQLFRVASELRRSGLTNPIGFFLHIPFPAPQAFTTIPVHLAIFDALLDYDVVGFQTESDRLAFTDYAVRNAGGCLELDGTVVVHGDRKVMTGVYPIGVQPDEIARLANQTDRKGFAEKLIISLRKRRLIISVDRLDYTKGLFRRFRAFEKFLEAHTIHRGRVCFTQIAPPSRSDVQTYRQIRTELEAETGRINGRFAEVDWVPIRYLNRGFARTELMPMYRVARVGLVTPLRDGMNLVAKEYVASQDPEDPGVLVLSEFAGAAAELDGALLVNPYDVTGMANALAMALALSVDERRERHTAMMTKLRRYDLSCWRDGFLRDLGAVA